MAPDGHRQNIKIKNIGTGRFGVADRWLYNRNPPEEVRSLMETVPQ